MTLYLMLVSVVSDETRKKYGYVDPKRRENEQVWPGNRLGE
jgi:hypothetical protein